MELLHQGQNISFFKVLNNGNYLVVQDNILRIIEKETKQGLMSWVKWAKYFNNAIELSNGNLLVSANNKVVILNPTKKKRTSIFRDYRRCMIKEIKQDLVLFDFKYLYNFKTNEGIEFTEDVRNVIFFEDVNEYLLVFEDGVKLLSPLGLDNSQKITHYFNFPEYIGDYKIVSSCETGGFFIYDVLKNQEIARIEGDEYLYGCVDDMTITYNQTTKIYKIYDRYGNLLLQGILDGNVYSIIDGCIIFSKNNHFYKCDIWLNNKELIFNRGCIRNYVYDRDYLKIYYGGENYFFKSNDELPPK